ncbi:MAG: hypothetical protein R6T78_00405 [Dehalococcoidales bacterium]
MQAEIKHLQPDTRTIEFRHGQRDRSLQERLKAQLSRLSEMVELFRNQDKLNVPELCRRVKKDM